MLRALLDGSGKVTQPVVAYGGPVRSWLAKAFPAEVKKVRSDLKLEVLDIVHLDLFDGGASTPVLCANHPSMYLFALGSQKKDKDDKADEKEKKQSEYPPQSLSEILTQDLIAAGWQAQMCNAWDADPGDTLEKIKKSWDSQAEEVKRLVKIQNAEFSYAS